MNDRTAFRYWLLAFAVCTISVVLCVAYIDRPVAEFFEGHLRHTALWAGFNRAFLTLDLVIVVALFFLLGCGIWVISGCQLPRWTATPFLCSLSAMWAVAATIIFKRICGRGWPDPTYIQDHLYGFHFLHGGPHWDAFPSGTATVSSAIVSVLWIVRPRCRVAWLLILVLLSAAVVIANYHWLSDVITGAFLGVTIGWSTVRLHQPDGIGS